MLLVVACFEDLNRVEPAMRARRGTPTRIAAAPMPGLRRLHDHCWFQGDANTPPAMTDNR